MTLDGVRPTKDELLEKQQKETSMWAFFDYVLPCIVGRNQWNKLRHEKQVSEFVTPSDEAFGFLILENIWDTWSTMSDKDCNDVLASRLTLKKRNTSPSDGNSTEKKETGREGKWTLAKKDKSGNKTNKVSAQRFRGWDPEGINHCGQLIDKVKKDRCTKEGQEMEQKYMDHWIKEKEGGNSDSNSTVTKKSDEHNMVAVNQDAELDAF